LMIEWARKSSMLFAEKEICKLFGFVVRGLELLRMHNLLHSHHDILKTVNRLATSLQMTAKDGCTKGTQFRLLSVRRKQFRKNKLGRRTQRVHLRSRMVLAIFGVNRRHVLAAR